MTQQRENVNVFTKLYKLGMIPTPYASTGFYRELIEEGRLDGKKGMLSGGGK